MIYNNKFYISRMRIKDIPDVIKLLSTKPANMITQEYGECMDKEKKSMELKDILNSIRTDRIDMIIRKTKNNKVIGYAYICMINWVEKICQISIIIDEKYHCIGYGPLASREIIEYCFRELNMNKVSAKIRDDNSNIPERIGKPKYRNLPISKGKYVDFYYTQWVKHQKIGGY
ncbi:GNAT family protein [Clostridiaceae bacterium M8S5]|nr:GNAT family protein [Clostridiaceae bacterium M8S5]